MVPQQVVVLDIKRSYILNLPLIWLQRANKPSHTSVLTREKEEQIDTTYTGGQPRRKYQAQD